MRLFLCLLIAFVLPAVARAEVDAPRAVAGLRGRGEYRQAEAYAEEQWQRDDLSESARAELAIQRALVYTEQALAAPPPLRDALWAKAEHACTVFVEGWPDNPRRVLVEVQGALVSLARGEQARQSGDLEAAREYLRLAARRLNDVDENVRRELIDRQLRQQATRSAEALSAQELESLEANVSFQLARAQRQFGLCYPPRSPDRDDALLQAVKRLTPLARRTPPDDLTWNARVELAACLRELGQTAPAKKLLAAWLQENPPTDVSKRLSAQPGALSSSSDIEADGVLHDDAFGAAMKEAASDCQAGRHALAAERYRRLALSYPNHARSSEAHRLAVLCMAELLRESPLAEHPPLAASYERLLREHLEHWPTHASAEKVRLWLGQLLAGRRDWSGALAVLQHVGPTSAVFSESVPVVVRCYEEQLQQADGDTDEAPRRAQLLADASSYLQPIITGPDNRWPDRWSELQLDTAFALVRLHLRYAAQGSTYPEQLLTAALRGRSDAQNSAEGQAWERAARVLLIESLARNGKAADARAMLDELDNAPVDLLLETLSAIDGQLARRSRMGTGNREVGELALSMLRIIDARRTELDATAISHLGVWRAAALAAAGDRAAALAQYAALAAESPDDGQIQERYAALLAVSDATPALRKALQRWQDVESRSRRGGPRWRRARQARIELLTRLGERTKAEKLVRLTRLLYPDWDAAETK